MTIQNAIKLIHATPDAWVRVEQTRRIPHGLELCFGVYRGKGGTKIDEWSIKCLGVREAITTALDGGGLRLYPSTHPAALRYTARTAQFRWTGVQDKAAIIGALYQAHIAVMNDWLPFDEVVSVETISKKKVICRGPEFLMRAYAKALRAKGERVQIVLREGSREKSKRLKVLHFGDSYVIASSFIALRQKIMSVAKP